MVVIDENENKITSEQPGFLVAPEVFKSSMANTFKHASPKTSNNPAAQQLYKTTLNTFLNQLDSDKTKRKIIALIITGICLISAGIVVACLFFHDRNKLIKKGLMKANGELDLTDTRTITGPLFISSGLLITT